MTYMIDISRSVKEDIKNVSTYPHRSVNRTYIQSGLRVVRQLELHESILY